MNLSRVIIFTHDVERLSEFYRLHFGLEPVSDPDKAWVELSSGTCGLAFHSFPDEVRGRDGWIKIVFGAKDVAFERERLVAEGVDMSEVVEFGPIRMCDGRDPDGNWFQISSRGI